MMPLMIGWMSLHFPSGLVIYWVVSNVYQFFQQLIMFRGEKGKEMINGPSKKGVVTVHADEEAVAKTKRKKIIRRKIIKKGAKKPAADEAPKAGDEKEKTASAEKTAEAGDSSGKAEG